jgi:hypothetical protein
MSVGRVVVGVLVVVVIVGALILQRYAFWAVFSAWRDMFKRRDK